MFGNAREEKMVGCTLACHREWANVVLAEMTVVSSHEVRNSTLIGVTRIASDVEMVVVMVRTP